jgi:hypothetical protein
VIYEQLYPETRHGATPSKAGGGKVPKTASNATCAADTAARTATAERTVRQDVQIAARITPEAKALLRGTPLADEKTELLRVARLPAEKQERARPAGAREPAWLRS